MNVSEINSVIDNLAAKLGVAAEFLNETLLRQAQVQLVKSSIWLAVSVGLCTFIVWWFAKMVKRNKDGESAWDKAQGSWRFSLEFSSVGAFVVMGIAFVSLAVIAVESINTMITCAVNPQWYAISEILSFLQGK